MNRYEKIAKRVVAGTWALPGTESMAKNLLKLIREMKAGEWPSRTSPVNDAVYHLFGDDALFDDMDEAGREYLKQCALHIETRIKQMAAMPASGFRSQADYLWLQQLAKRV